MSRHANLPRGVEADGRVVLFDGVCRVCSAWVPFLLARDRRRRLRFASMQSDAGRAILAWAGLPTNHSDTMVFVEGERAYTKSTAFLRVVRHLVWPWGWLAVGVVVPAFLRDWLYDRVALNRYRLFGRRETCLVPTPDVAARFL